MKYYGILAFTGIENVTLRVRVWIEIFSLIGVIIIRRVTLRVRVWIEISMDEMTPLPRYGHPPCEGVD